MDHYLTDFHKTAVKSNLSVAQMSLNHAREYQLSLVELSKNSPLPESDKVDLSLRLKAIDQINEELTKLIALL